MKRAFAAFVLATWLASGVVAPAFATNPSDPPVETTRSKALRAVYFPFLALGHGIILVGKYGIAYPLWFLGKPLYDTLYESSEDPEELRTTSSSSTD